MSLKKSHPSKFGIPALFLAATAITAPAAAQESEKQFGGLYVGAETGLDRGKLSLESENRKLLSETGFYGGGLLGWRYQFDNNIVLGVEYSVGYSSVKQTRVTTVGDVPAIVSLKHGWHDNIVGNLGLALGQDRRSMIFGTIGTSITSSDNDDDAVLVLGGGFEQMISPRTSFRIRVTHLSDFDFLTINQSQLKVLAGVLFRF